MKNEKSFLLLIHITLLHVTKNLKHEKYDLTKVIKKQKALNVEKCTVTTEIADKKIQSNTLSFFNVLCIHNYVHYT